MLIAFTWLVAIVGLALSLLVPFAAGMRTVPRLSGSDAALAVPLPILAILLAAAYLARHLDAGRGVTLLVGGIPMLLALGGLGVLAVSFIGQPHPPAAARAIRDFLRPRPPVKLHFYRDVTRAGHTLRLANIPGAGPEQTTPPDHVGDVTFDQVHVRGNGAAIEAAYAVECTGAGGQKIVAFVGGGGSHTLPDAASLAAIDDRCFVALGRDLVCLSLPRLDLRWRLALDSVAMGVHPDADETFLVVRDAETLYRISFDGTIAWRFKGKGDPLTRDLEIDGDEARIVDCYGTSFRVALGDGSEIRS